MQQQQKNFTESLGDLCQCITKPMVELSRLNMDTFNHLAKNSDYLENFMQAKKPEEIMAAQIKFANAASLESFKYMQKASAILMEAANQNGRMFTEMAKQTTAQAQKAAEPKKK